MRVLTKDEFELEKELCIDAILKGAVFIYPTDTIYGLGCNAKDSKAVSLIRDIKKRPLTPFSVIAPSKAWIEENCIVDKKADEWIGKLPGPYTLILRLKNKDCVANDVVLDAGSLGVRIPEHWFSRIVGEIGVPVVTTSVNEAGKKFMNSMEDIDPHIEHHVDFMIDEGIKDGKPSTIVHLEGKEVSVKHRH